MTIGLLGGGQLGRMLALAGYPLGLRFRSLDHNSEAPAGRLAEFIVGDFDDLDALDRFADGIELVTYEFENIPVSTARYLNERVPVFPPPKALESAQDRLVEKRFFQSLGIPTPNFAQVDTLADLEEAVDSIGLPSVLKTRRFGYDGKGQFVLRDRKAIQPAWESVGGRPLILEAFVAFERELSTIAVRGRSGEIAFYPLVENRHSEGILRLSLAPAARLSPECKEQAEMYGRRALEALDYVGVLAIEWFELNGQLYANEMAPRVHNSGHWTIEGAVASQFENHLRAILGLDLGSTDAVGHTAMINLIGTIPDLKPFLCMRDAHLHLYDKAPRAGRKLGHVTIRAEDAGSLESKLNQIKSSFQF